MKPVVLNPRVYRLAAVAVIVTLSACGSTLTTVSPTTSSDTQQSTTATTNPPNTTLSATSKAPTTCCGPISYSSEHTVTGILGRPVPVIWSTGTGVVTLHQVMWDIFPLGDSTSMLLMIEVTFKANSGTVNYGRMSWIQTDAAGRRNGVDVPLLTGTNLHELPDTATLQPGQADTGWAAFLISDPPTAPIEISLIEFDTTTELVSWTTDGPPQEVLDVVTSSEPVMPRTGHIYQCPDLSLTLKVANFDAPSDFHGQPSPGEAAQRFAESGVIGGIPTRTPWRLGPTDATGVFVTIEGIQMHAVQSPTNQTWVIDEVQYCSS